MPTIHPFASRERQLPQRVGALGLVLPLLASGLAVGVAPLAQAADAGDGTVKVRVVREVNANGKWDNVLEPGMSEVEVRLTDDAGTTITGRTGPDGTVTLTPATSALKGGKYRIQVMNPKPGVLYSAHASREGLLGGSPEFLSSTEEFVDLSGGGDAEVTTAFWNPGDYCQKNATLVTACMRKDVKEGPADNETRTLISFPYNARGNRNQTTDLSDKATTGALYGIGYSKQKKWIFSGAFARRASDYGPGGRGAIYVTDRESGATTQFATVPNAGATDHDFDTDMDLPFKKAVSKESLGDVEVSEDGKDLYVVNLNDRKLYRYDATQKTAAAPKASYTIPDPGCADAGDWRPGAIGIQDGTVYVGGVCSGESSQDRADMRASVQTFDPAAGTFGGVIMDQKLDFPRQVADTIANGCYGAGWFPWSDQFRNTQGTSNCGRGGRYAYPQPFLTDVIVDTDGQLILGFRDRFADQAGQNLTERDATGTFLLEAMSGGDLNRACKAADGKFVMDGNGGCTNNSTVAGISEFYPGDQRTVWHPESAFGGVALSKVEDTIASSGIDVDNATTFSSGTLWVNRVGGGAAQGFGNVQSTTFGKGGSMADLEVLCDEAPIQIGNRVWYDVDKDGVQDPGEKPVPGATVNLYDANGALVATTTTTDRGEYYFDSAADGLKFNTKYTIKIDNPADYAEGGPLYRWAVTKNDAGANDFIDSDGKVPAGGRFPEHTITTGSAGQDNHTYDFGYNQPDGEVRVLKVDAKTKKPLQGAVFQLWRDTNGTDGLQTAAAGDTPADTKVGATCTTNAKGLCARDGQPLGTYYWQETKAPGKYALPKPAVFGPLTLTFENYAQGVSTTVPNVEPKIDIEKKDKETNSDADTEKDKVILPDTRTKTLYMDITNNGSEPLIKIEVGDIVTKGGAKVSNLRCNWPDGTSSFDPKGRKVRWDNTWPPNKDTKAKSRFAVGATYKCTALLTGLRAGEVHADNSTVDGEGEFSGKPVKDRDPWHGIPPKFVLLKLDAKTKKPLKGAVFQLWRESNGKPGLQSTGAKRDTKVGAACATDPRGKCEYTTRLGRYYLQETAVPEGYQLPAKRVFGPYKVTKKTKVLTVKLYNKPSEPKKKK
ncbi:SpaA isopeptide-forming pilin-related protein [Streptomyces sp. NPDC050504]|uniref:SpaA isopeptide-forming pilin-related protein n=1 Tax=Streptomyces sp. NPDC050504 TaxID=3365618 RepID=UPI00379D8F52